MITQRDNLFIKDLPQGEKSSSFIFILVMGFATLILLILSSGFISAYQVSLTRITITNLEQDYLNQINVALKIRDLISQINFEAQQKVIERRSNLSLPPFTAIPPALDKDLNDQLNVLANADVGKTKEWQRFQLSLNQFIETVTNPFYFQLNGAKDQQQAVTDLNEVLKAMRTERTKIAQQSQLLQAKAERAIVITTLISLIVGLMIAVIAIREIQKRFNQLQLSYRTINQAREFNKNIVNGVINALFTLDSEGHLISANQAFYQLINRDSSLIGTDYLKIFSNEEELSNLITESYKNIATSINYRGRVNLMPDSVLIRSDVYITPLKFEDGIKGLIVVLVDVTELERAQEERQRQQALIAIGQIAAQVAHEIKNPLGSIKLNISYLQRSIPPNTEAREVTDEIQMGVERLNRTVMELSNFMRPKQLTLSSGDINTVIGEQLLLVTDRIEQKQIEIIRQFQKDLPRTLIDRHELGKAFINFIINAIDASEKSSKITIITSCESAQISIKFIDNGTGMSRETLARLFEPFFTNKSHGTGLGMSIAKQVIEMHQGQINAKSRLGQGSEITVLIPVKT